MHSIEKIKFQIYSNLQSIKTSVEEQINIMNKINKDIDIKEKEKIQLFIDYFNDLIQLYNQNRTVYNKSLTHEEIKRIEDNIKKDELITKYSELDDIDKTNVKELINEHKSTYKNSSNSEELIERLNFVTYYNYQDIYKLFSILRKLYAKEPFNNEYSMYDLKDKSNDELERQIDELLKSISKKKDDLTEIIKQSINNIQDDKYTDSMLLKMRMNFRNYEIKFAGSITNVKKIRRSKKY